MISRIGTGSYMMTGELNNDPELMASGTRAKISEALYLLDAANSPPTLGYDEALGVSLSAIRELLKSILKE